MLAKKEREGGERGRAGEEAETRRGENAVGRTSIDDRSRGRPRASFHPHISHRIVSDSRDLCSPPRSHHFFYRLGSLSATTIVIKGRVNEPH